MKKPLSDTFNRTRKARNDILMKPKHTQIEEAEFQEKLRDLPHNSALGMEGRYRIIIQGIGILDKCKWWEWTKKRRVNAVIRKAVCNKI